MNDLDTIGYKWPKYINATSKSDLNFTIYFRPPSTKLKPVCKLINKSFNDSTMNSLILVTYFTEIDNMDTILKVASIHFKYIVGCYNFKIDKWEQLLNSTSSGLTLIYSSSFKKCVYIAVNMGFKLNTFIFIKYFYTFEFWAKKVELIEPKADEKVNFADLNSSKVSLLICYSIYLKYTLMRLKPIG